MHIHLKIWGTRTVQRTACLNVKWKNATKVEENKKGSKQVQEPRSESEPLGPGCRHRGARAAETACCSAERTRLA